MNRSARRAGVGAAAASTTLTLALAVLALLALLGVLGAGPALAGTTTSTTSPATTSPATTSPATSEDSTVGTPSGPITVQGNLAYGSAPGQTLDVYRPAAPGQDRPAVVLVHGGGWVGGGADDMATQATQAARQGWVVFNVNYRGTSTLGTHGQAWPTEVDDVREAITWAHDHAPEHTADPDRLAVLGASAGGNLVAVATADGLPGVKAQALWSAPTDLAELAPVDDRPPAACGDSKECQEFWMVGWVPGYLGCMPSACPDTYRAASPVEVVGRGTPPTYIVNSTDEIVPMSQAEELAKSLERAGVHHELRAVDGDRHAYDYNAEVWNDMMPFLADELGVPQPEPIDFSSSPLGLDAPLLVTLAIAVILLVMLVAVAITRGRADDRKPVL